MTYVFIMLYACASSADELGCLDGDIIESAAKHKEIVQTFHFSRDCMLRGKNEHEILMRGPEYVNLEIYLPGIISYKKMTELSQKSITSKEKIDYIKSFLTLSYSPSSLMISSVIDEYYLQNKYEIIKEDDSYGYFIRKYKTVSSKNIVNKTIFIAPKFRKDFWVVCMKKQCFVTGVVGNIRYELNLKTSKFQDWLKIHEAMNKFITKIHTVSK